MTLDEAYSACRTIVRQSGSSFYYGMRLLPEAKRRSIYAVYAWSRMCDDAVDDHEGEAADRKLESVRELLEQSIADRYSDHASPVVHALGDSIRRFELPLRPFYGLLEGMRMDIEQTAYQTFDDLREYLTRVAGTVGELCIGIFGTRRSVAKELANDMGVALQLTNIIRDLKEDVLRGRVYLPTNELAQFGYSVEDMHELRESPAFYDMMAYQVQRAHEYFDRAQGLFNLVESDALRSLSLLYSVYLELLESIERDGYHVFTHRIRVSTPRKLLLAGGALWPPRKE